MNHRWLLTRVLAGGLLLALTLGVLAQDSKSDDKKKKAPADPPRTTPWMNQLRQLFDTWDTSKDSYLDKKELAVAFRGTGAKPYDIKETKSEESQKDKATTEKEKPGKTPDYSAYADYQVLTQLDKDQDGQVSRDEFMEWAREYAMQLRDQTEAVKKAQDLQRQIGKLKAKDKNRDKLETQLKRQQQEINKLQDKVKKYANIQNKLK